jgi:hypothetical protein
MFEERKGEFLVNHTISFMETLASVKGKASLREKDESTRRLHTDS